jgi:hypothetical protein
VHLYDALSLYVNLIQPIMKLLSKTRNGAKVHRVYRTARARYQRLLEAGVLVEVERQELAAVYHGLNAVLLLKQIDDNLECLWRLAECPATLHFDVTHLA